MKSHKVINISYFLSQGLSLNSGLTNLAKLVGWEAQGSSFL